MSSSILSAPNLQIWDNAAFDDVLPLQPISLNLDDPIKENRSPSRSQPKPKPSGGAGDIDAEIAEIEGEISRLSKKLEALKIKKAQILAASKTPTPGPTKRRGGGGGGRSVPAKFLNLETHPPPLPPSASSSKNTTIQESRRRRGLSLGPMEIYHNATPLRAPPKPSFQRLGGIKEEEKSKLKEKENEKKKNLTSARRRGMSLGPSEILRRAGGDRSLSISPKSRKPMNSRVTELRKGISTVLPKKSVKMEEGSISGIIKPKTLFEEKKRPLKSAKVRIVASRYNEEGSKRRKWSLPEDEKKGEEKSAAANRKKRALSLGGANAIRLKEEMGMERSPPPSITKIAEGLPKIRTLRGAIESPRDSGCAKRVAELVGRKSCFAGDGEVSGSSSCQSLNFEEDG